MLVLQKLFLFSLTGWLFLQTAAPSKQELNDQLYDAVRKGDVAGVTSALERGADVNAKFRYGTTALFKAAERGNSQITKILLDRGADVKVKDTFYGATAMTWALDGKHIEVVRLLLETGGEEGEDVLLEGTRGPYMPTPIVYGELLYTCSNQGVLAAYNASTGERVYQERLGGTGGAFTASPVASEGKIYFAGEDGDVFVVKAGPQYELLAKNPVGEVMMATPAISDGLLIVRTVSHLYAFGEK